MGDAEKRRLSMLMQFRGSLPSSSGSTAHAAQGRDKEEQNLQDLRSKIQGEIDERRERSRFLVDASAPAATDSEVLQLQQEVSSRLLELRRVHALLYGARE